MKGVRRHVTVVNSSFSLCTRALTVTLMALDRHCNVDALEVENRSVLRLRGISNEGSSPTHSRGATNPESRSQSDSDRVIAASGVKSAGAERHSDGKVADALCEKP